MQINLVGHGRIKSSPEIIMEGIDQDFARAGYGGEPFARVATLNSGFCNLRAIKWSKYTDQIIKSANRGGIRDAIGVSRIMTGLGPNERCLSDDLES